MNQEFADYTNYENQEQIEELNNDTQLASLKENEFINSIENANVDPTNLPSKEDYSQYLIDN